MSFLQPWVLLGLPLIALPIIIHLLNRLRHRPKPWAAMRFLVSATRSSISQTRLRQFLILACRVLAVAMLVLFLARPLAGGWLGWALSPAPDAILILLDRSASMETSSASISKRQHAINLLAQAAAPFEQTTHLILIDSATRSPQEIARADSLTRLSVAGPTDTAADLPAMMRAAFDWLIENRAGTAEIWIASDNQRSNWMPDDARWKNVIASFSGLSQKVRIRLLELTQPPDANASVAIKEMLRHPRGDQSELQMILDVQRNRSAPESMPVTLTLDGARSTAELKLDGQSLRWRRKIDLGTRREGGWGSFALPADSNSRDNTAYFVYGPDMPLVALVVSANKDVGRYFQFAAAGRGAQPAAMIAPADFANAPFDGKTLLIWQAPVPTGADAERVRAFSAEGGNVIFFPPSENDAHQFQGMGWGDAQNAEGQAGFRILRWEEEEGPLAKSDEHQSLPLAQTTFARRRVITGQKNALAAFDDGAAFLTRATVGRGTVYFCASLPDPGWSSLGDGPVLVPMLQRMLMAGGQRLQQVTFVSCGELSAVDQARQWVPVDSTDAKDVRTQAGVYRSGDRYLAVNRPASEDEPEIISSEQARKLFGDLPVQTLQERRFDVAQLQGEIWRAFVFAMLLFLLAEAALILPSKRAPPATTSRPLSTKTKESEVEMV
jgi:hypothetical protein